MPKYDFECAHCNQVVERVKSFTDESAEVCDTCGKELRKVLSVPAGIIFTGDGFYSTDKRKKSE